MGEGESSLCILNLASFRYDNNRIPGSPTSLFAASPYIVVLPYLASKGRLVYILLGVVGCVRGSGTVAFGGSAVGQPIQEYARLAVLIYCREEPIAAKMQWSLEKEM